MIRGGAREAPLFAGKIHGVRGWSLRDGRLCGPYMDQEWASGGASTRATCDGCSKNAVPARDCGCGLYGLHPWSAEAHGEVVGVIEAWGRVEVHASGFRAEYARPAALFASAGHPDAADAARRHRCELVEISSWDEVPALCEARGWGLARAFVEDLVPEPEPPQPDRLSAPPMPARSGTPWPAVILLAPLWAAGALLVGAVWLAWYAFCAVMALAALEAATGWDPLGLDLNDGPIAYVRAADVRIKSDAIVRADGDGPPLYVARLENRGREAAVWARPSVRYTSGGRARTIGRREVAYPATVPAGGEALVVQPLHGVRRRDGVRVEPGPVAAREVERPPVAPARLWAELVPTRGRRCALVARVRAREPLQYLRMWLVPIDERGRPITLLAGRARDVPAGGSRHVIERYTGCDPRLPEVRAFPAFGPGQLLERGG